jgi:predicted cobalt transporter CbtA
MISRLIGRGLLAGAAAGLCIYVFTITVVEPVINKAIAYEGAVDGAHEAMAHSHAEGGGELFSRTFQGYVGSGVATILYGLAMGALVAVAYVIATGRVGSLRARTLGLLIPAFGFIGIFAVPFAKYPANPPAIGLEETIRQRGADYLIMLAASCLLLFFAVYVGQKLRTRMSAWNASLVMGVLYLLAVAAVMVALPNFHETPGDIVDANGHIILGGFPADVLAQFRVYSIANQLVLWSVLGLVFAPLAAKVVEGTRSEELV